jgi:hypothetical protein
MDEKGILYVGTGEEYRDGAKNSAKHVQTVVDCPIALVTDRGVPAGPFDEVIVDPDPQYSYVDKPRNLGRSPFSQTLFIDTDVYIVKGVDNLFEALEYVDLAAVVDPNEDALRLMNKRYYEDLPESIPEYNTGVVLYSRRAIEAGFFESWVENHSELHYQDQISFRRTLAESNIQFSPLSNVYNCLIDWPMQVTGEVKILHDISRKLDEDNVGEVTRRINRTTGPRLLYSGHDRIVYPLSEPGDALADLWWRYHPLKFRAFDLFTRGLRSLRRDGVVPTLRKALKRF